MKELIYKKIIKLVKTNSPVQDKIITKETKLFEDLNFDSIAMIKLLVDAEEEFGFDAKDSAESLEAYESVETFADFVEEMVKRNSKII